MNCGNDNNKAGYIATLVACGWARAVIKKLKNAKNVNSRKSVRWSAVPDTPM